MKKCSSPLLMILTFVCLFANNTFSQTKTLPNSFEIKGDIDKSKLAFYKSSIEAASMESFRLKETDVVLNFKEGFECIIYSAKSLSLKGMAVNINDYRTSFEPNYKLPVFSIASNGHLSAEVSILTKFTTK